MKTNLIKPEIDKEYHFLDDGKISPSRHYICKVIDIISLEQAKNIALKFTPFEEITEEEDGIIPKMSLYDIWQYQKENCDWYIAEDKYCIVVKDTHINIGCFSAIQHTFSFPTRKMAEEFLKYFKDLFEQCKNII